MEEVQEEYQRASKLIKNATILLVMSGAGMSADSGLKTYEEINQEISDKNLEYRDYCDPELLEKDPLEFWKFWCASSHDYANAKPHHGYEILKKWHDKKIAQCPTSMKTFFKAFFRENAENYDESKEVPVPFFVYSSNVDGLFKRVGIQDHEICEIHGNANVLQCADGINCKGKDAEEHRYWPASLLPSYSCVEDLPKCPCCHKICRPSVLMFNDEEWLGLEDEGTTDFELYDVWELAVEAYLMANPKSSLVIIEVGCGDKVPVVKMESETVLGDITNLFTNDGQNKIDDISNRIALIRINKVKSEFLGYHEEWSHGNSFIDMKSIICFEGSCNEVLQQLDELMD